VSRSCVSDNSSMLLVVVVVIVSGSNDSVVACAPGMKNVFLVCAFALESISSE
jgi:hypothetical protein